MTRAHILEREFCPVCRSQNVTTLFRSPFTDPPIRKHLDLLFASVGRVEYEYLDGAAYILDECIDCGLVFQREILDDHLMELLYTKWIDPWKTLRNHEQSDDLPHFAQYAQEVMMMIVYFRAIPSQLRMLDFGMGWGNWCRMAGAFGCDAYGFEPCGAKAEIAESRGVKTLDREQISEHEFHFINVNHVLEHLSLPLDTLRFLTESLTDDGILKVAVPDGKDIKKRLKSPEWTAPPSSSKSLNPVSPLTHINCFHHASLIRAARLAGLVPVKIPVRDQFVSSTYWRMTKPMIKNLLRPFYRNWCQKSTYLFFRREDA